jgi:hypothetical protein
MQVNIQDGHVLPPTAIARGPAAAFGVFSSEDSDVFVAQPSQHRIERIDIDLNAIPANGQLPSTSIRVGVGITNAVRLQTAQGPVIAAVLSDDTLHTINETTGEERLIASPPGLDFVSSLPLQADDAGNLLAVVYGPANELRLLSMTGEGVKIAEFSIDLSQVFSIATRGDHVILVDRLAGQVQTLNLVTGASDVITLTHTRPREAVMFADGSWLVVHDTNPDIGVSIYRNGAVSFAPYTYKGGRWLIEVVELHGTQVLLADFGGKLVAFDAVSGSYGPSVELPFDQLTYAASDGNKIWAVSATHGKVAVLDADTLILEDVFTVDNAHLAMPVGGEAGWLVTGTQLMRLSTIWDR